MTTASTVYANPLIPLWPGSSSEMNRGERPFMVHYPPLGTRHLGAAVLILPGGGYRHLSVQEGEGFAGVFRLWGISSFVCHYRLGSDGFRHPTMLQDAARAMRVIRGRASEWGIDPARVWVAGSSAGGHLASMLITHWDRGMHAHPDPIEHFSSRPDLAMLCYPVVTMGEETNPGSREMLLGPNPSCAEIQATSAHLHVKPDTPPVFLWHTWQDPLVSVANTLLFAEALRKSGIPFEAHIYEKGPHGQGMKNEALWLKDCFRWLNDRFPLQPLKNPEEISS
jgi:acetyl esterase/lipase